MAGHVQTPPASVSLIQSPQGESMVDPTTWRDIGAEMKSSPSAIYSALGVALIVLGLTLAIVIADTTSARVFASAVAVLGVILAAYGVRKRVTQEDTNGTAPDM